MRRVRLTARARLTTFYGVLFLLSGVVLVSLVVTAAFTRSGGEKPPVKVLVKPSDQDDTAATKDVLAKKEEAAREAARDEVRRNLITASALAIGLMTVTALGLGWVMAGRVLRPIRSVSSAARRLSEQDLHERIPVRGPDDELKELAETFNGMIARLERAFTAQRLFTANASHELRGPMTTQRALVDVTLATPGISRDAAELATTLREVLRRQERLVNGLFELACSQHGAQRRDLVRLDLVTRDVLARRRLAADAAGVTVLDDLTPVTIPGDAVLIEILVDNLVRNAITHNQPGGWLRVRTTADTISVENTGTEVSAQRLAELVQPFRRGARDRTNGTPGAGLGLAIVDTVATAHGGRLRLMARPGGGIVVTVAFPLILSLPAPG